MKSRRRHALHIVAIAIFFATLICPGDAPARPEATAVVDSPASIAVRPEGRLRKLHLVRPDLIPYPIASEVYC